MSGVGRTIRIGIVGSNDIDPAARLGNAMKLANKRHHVRNMFNDVTADDLVEFVIGKWIGQHAQIVNDVSRGAGV